MQQSLDDRKKAVLRSIHLIGLSEPKILDIDRWFANWYTHSYNPQFSFLNDSNHPDWEHIPSPSNYFDMVFVGDSILESDLLGWHLQEIKRVLRPGGIVTFYIPNPTYHLLRFQRYPTLYNPRQLIKHCKVNGFKIAPYIHRLKKVGRSSPHIALRART